MLDSSDRQRLPSARQAAVWRWGRGGDVPSQSINVWATLLSREQVVANAGRADMSAKMLRKPSPICFSWVAVSESRAEVSKRVYN